MTKTLDIDRIKQFESRPAPRSVEPESIEPSRAPAERWPSREPIKDGQISIKAPLDVIERFKRICKEDRRTYADMLGILMDKYDLKE